MAGNDIAEAWFGQRGWHPHDFQLKTWKAVGCGHSGLLNAPTGFGKTYALWFGVLHNYFHQKKRPAGLHCLWITPLRALSKEIHSATQRVSDDLGLDYNIGLRTGDTSTKERTKQKKGMPHGLITTPESVHLMLAQKGYADVFGGLKIVVVDEWHELLGSKRGVLIELALSRLRALNPGLMVWGISATIGNLEEAKEILLGQHEGKSTLIRSKLEKSIEIETVLPEVVDRYPWGGHLGISAIDSVLDIVRGSNSTLIFTNTRSQCEIWYQRLLERDAGLAGIIAIHHGSLSEEVRNWVENAIHDGLLKVVVCTSSLDLGVDFRPVDTVIQIASPKGVARFMQRAGRSGHRPGEISRIYFVPSHSLEIIEGSALRHAIAHHDIEQRLPYIRSFDALVQYMVTLAVSDGFNARGLYDEIVRTHCYASVSWEEFAWCLSFITEGGKLLDSYDEFHKVVLEDDVYRVTDRSIASRHRLSIGVIVNDTMIQVKFATGGKVGTIEESFISRLRQGDTFWFAGRNLELVGMRNMEAIVKKSNKGKGIFPAWQGGRMPLSSQLSGTIRHKLDEYYRLGKKDREINALVPLFEEQQRCSHLPHPHELLIEKVRTDDGYHIFVYPFEGRNVHEGLAAIFANRIAAITPMTFSIAFNDYGFELLCDREIPIEEALRNELLSTEGLSGDIAASVNITEMARRKFRDIASIAGLVFNGYPGKAVKTRHTQASSQLFFNVFTDMERDNLLLQQAYDEVMTFQMEENRMRDAMVRMMGQQVVVRQLEQLSPFSFPIFTEVFREKYTNEAFEDRVRKMLRQLDR